MPLSTNLLNNNSTVSASPRKHRKKVRADVISPAVSSNQPISPRNAAPPRPPQPGRSEGDDEAAGSLLASSQRRPSDSNKPAEMKTRASKGTKSSLQPQPQAQTQFLQKNPTSSSSPPHPKPSAKHSGGRHPEPGSRCDTCIIQRRGCDGVRPVCGRCAMMRRDCEWHEERISRSELEGLRNRNGNGNKRGREEMEMMSGAAIEDRLSEEEAVKWRARKAKREEQVRGLKAREDELRRVAAREELVGATVVDAAAMEGVNRWLYKDHVDMLETITQPRIDPVTEGEVFGHWKGNRIFDDTSKALEEFDGLDDLEESVVPMERYECLKLNWEESEQTYDVQKMLWEGSKYKRGMPTASLSHGAGCLSTLRKRVGLPDRLRPRVEVLEVRERRSGGQSPPKDIDPMLVAYAGADDFAWVDNLMDGSHHAKDWNDGGRLPEPRETHNGTGDDDMLD